MAIDQPEAPDEQDLAETFDETNITPDGEDIATSDMERDVYDATSADGDDDVDDNEADDDDFDPDKIDEEETEYMLEEDNDAGREPRTFRRDDADLVQDDDTQPDSLQASDDDEADDDDRDPAARQPVEHDPHVERQLDHGLDETFPASDPVSINPGAD